MAIATITLAPCRLFANASTPALQYAAAHMQLHHLRKREVIAGGAFDGLGVVLQGSVQAIDATLDGKEVALFSVSTHDSFGHQTLLAPNPIALTWVATSSATTVALLERPQALELVQFPELVLQLARTTSAQVCDLLGWQLLQSIHPISARVCAWLLRASGTDGALQLPTHAELAWRLNTTRESITRVLQKLLTDQVLQRDGDWWRIQAPTTLQELARGER